VKVATGLAEIFQGGGQHGHFAYLFLVAQVAMQMNVLKTLYCFYTTRKMPHESTRSICIYLKSFSGGSVRACHKGVLCIIRYSFFGA